MAQLSTYPQAFMSGQIAPLPSPPLLDRYVFEQPWLIMAILVAAGAAGWWVLSTQRRPRPALLAGVAGVALAAAAFLASRAVTTPRETCRQLTRTVVNHVVAGDTAALSPMLRTDVVVRPFGLTHDGVLNSVATHMRGQYAVKEPRFLTLDAAQDSPHAVRTRLHLRVTPVNALYAAPVGSWWMLTWQRAPGNQGAWLISQIECLQIDGVSDPATARP